MLQPVIGLLLTLDPPKLALPGPSVPPYVPAYRRTQAEVRQRDQVSPPQPAHQAPVGRTRTNSQPRG